MFTKRIFLLVACVLLCATCRDADDISGDESYASILEKTPINPSFEQSPPIANAIEIEVLEEALSGGENIRFVAAFDQGKVEGPYLAVLMNDQKVVLRDDGQGADLEANDNRFSIFLRDDVDRIQSELRNRKEIALTTDTLPLFRNRSFRTIDKGGLQDFNIDQFPPGVLFPIPLDIFKIFPFSSDPFKTLMVTDLDVVEDPTRTFNPCTGSGTPAGVWTFGELMRQMASPNPGSIATDTEVSDFVLNWLNTWTVPQVINGDNLPVRNLQTDIITPWINASGAPAGQLDMELAPFKLLAIVNRLDLRGNSGYGISDAGEGRFVFGALDPACNSLPFTVIFEYGINKSSCPSVKAFAQEWDDLDALVLGSAAYNTALENITNQFTQSGTNPSKPNQNSINQIRTNEFLSSPWELREFNLNDGGQLELTTVKQEPKQRHNGVFGPSTDPDVTTLVSFINSNSASIVNDDYTVPTPLLGGRAPVPSPSYHWNGRGASGAMFISSDQARHVFSLNTCSGCHGGETSTFFTHIAPSTFGIEANLSGFLTGITVTDAANRPVAAPASRTFNDLDRRESDLAALMGTFCLPIPEPVFELAALLTFNPLNMTH